MSNQQQRGAIHGRGYDDWTGLGEARLSGGHAWTKTETAMKRGFSLRTPAGGILRGIARKPADALRGGRATWTDCAGVPGRQDPPHRAGSSDLEGGPTRALLVPVRSAVTSRQLPLPQPRAPGVVWSRRELRRAALGSRIIRSPRRRGRAGLPE